MKLTQRATVVIVALLIVLSCCSCSGNSREEEKIRICVKNFENCCHSLDITGLLACFDPKDTVVIQAGLVGIELITGTDSDEILSEVVMQVYSVVNQTLADSEWPEVDSEELIKNCVQSITINPSEVTISKDRNDCAVANCVVTIKVEDKEIRTRTELYLIKSGGEWYIDLP